MSTSFTVLAGGFRLIKANREGKYSYDGVFLTNGNKFSWDGWSKKIDSNFEKYFWIDEASTETHVNKRSIYKDSYGSSIPWADYQLRPNFLIALSLAPQMVNKAHAQQALQQCRLSLMNEPNTVGIKTLDASDYNYCGYYDNSNDSDDMRVAHGFNYHQGERNLSLPLPPIKQHLVTAFSLQDPSGSGQWATT